VQCRGGRQPVAFVLAHKRVYARGKRQLDPHVTTGQTISQNKAVAANSPARTIVEERNA
jgi:hypothetical protein